MNFLGQNPQFHVTPTNGVISLVMGIRDSWTGNDAFRAQGLNKIESRISSCLRGLLYGFYEKELSNGKIVFDKHRGWLSQIEVLESALRQPIKVLCPVRDVKDVVASFEKLYRKSPLSRHGYLGSAYAKSQTIQGRAQVLLDEAGVIGHSILQIRDALNRGTADRLIIIPYNNFVTSPIIMSKYIYQELGIPYFENHNPNYVPQITHEDDYIYGWGSGLHNIRPTIELTNRNSWEGILPNSLCDWIDREFADINHLASVDGELFYDKR